MRLTRKKRKPGMRVKVGARRRQPRIARPKGGYTMGKSLNVHLVVIDPQNDFMGNDDGSPYSVSLKDGTALTASLPVKGAVSDMQRLTQLVDRLGPRLDDIHVTLDSHRVIDVAHAGMWRDAAGRTPAPFTIIRYDDIANSIW